MEALLYLNCQSILSVYGDHKQTHWEVLRGRSVIHLQEL
jgi:hypothetical protein